MNKFIGLKIPQGNRLRGWRCKNIIMGS